MTYTKNQHMLSQWFLRNFCSDDTALSPKGRQRVWCHVVVPGAEGQNDIKDIPLPVSSVAICKDCFRLTDGETGESFDIEHELSEYENKMAALVRDLVQNHNFARLANCSLYRDIKTLQNQGVCIEGGTGIGYIIKSDFHLPPLNLSHEEINAITLGLNWVSHNTDCDFKNTARNAIAKIHAVIPDELKNLIESQSYLTGPSENNEIFF